MTNERESLNINMEELKSRLANAISVIADLKLVLIEDDISLGQLGFNSLHYTLLSAELSDMLDKEINPIDLFNLPTLTHICNFVQQQMTLNSDLLKQEVAIEPGHEKIDDYYDSEAYSCALAIVGLSCHMPQADNIDSFWQNLIHGRDCIENIPSNRWSWQQVYGQHDTANRTYANEGGFISGIEQFDFEFFKISPREAQMMDPRQRLLMQGVWHTLEDSGVKAQDLKGQDIGVFIAASGDEYMNLLTQASHIPNSYTLTGNGRTFLSNRLSYHFGWTGPSEVIDTTCSSSLVALHNAQRAINDGACSSAIVGGISILIDPQPQIALSNVGVLSKDCRCKAFDSQANGYVRSEGMGLIMLKPLSQARRDGDRIHAVIRGSSVNHGGQSSSLTAPNSKAQAALIQSVYQDYNIEVQGLGYIEAHGTGTQLGDPIEIQGIKTGLSAVFTSQGLDFAQAQSISVGSVKTNIGHTEAAAGIAGLLKVIKSLQEKSIAPLVHINKINEKIDLTQSPFVFTQQAESWTEPEQGFKRKASVSAFGFGGVNAHVVVEEYPRYADDSNVLPDVLLLPLSATNQIRLSQYVNNVYYYLLNNDDINLTDVLYTFQCKRTVFSVSIVFYGRDKSELLTSFVDYMQQANQPQLPHDAAAAALVKSYMQTKTADWDSLYTNLTIKPQVITCPSYPFSPDLIWPEILDKSTYGKAGYELVKSSTNHYQIQLHDKLSFIADHIVDGIKILPSAGYIAFIEDLAQKHLGYRGILQISNLVWTTPVRFDYETPVILDVLIDTKSYGKCYIQFQSTNDGQVIKHCSAVVEVTNQEEKRSKIRDGNNQFTQKLSHEYIYQKLNQVGLSFGLSLKTIQMLWTNEWQAFSQINCRSEITQAQPNLSISLLDGIFQTIMAHQSIALEQDTLKVPFSIDSILVYRHFDKQMYVRAELKESKNKTVSRYDLSVFNIDGAQVLQINGSVGLALNSQTTGSTLAASHVSSYNQKWRTFDLAIEGAQLDNSMIMNVVSKHDDVAASLTKSLFDKQDNLYCLDMSAERADQLQAMADTFTNKVKSINKAGRPLQIQILASADEFTLQQALLWQKQLYFLIKQLLLSRLKGPLSLSYVLIYNQTSLTQRLMCAVDSFGRGVTHEYPRLPAKLVSLNLGNKILNEYDLQWFKYQLLRTSGLKIATTIELNIITKTAKTLYLNVQSSANSANTDWPVQRNSAYIISGGMGRVGLFIAHYIIRLGGKVVLLGRSEFNNKLAKKLQSLGSEKAQYFTVDVTNTREVDKLVNKIRVQHSRIGGVVHCAGIPPNALLVKKKLQDYEAITQVKIQGALNLDQATCNDPLDIFFVCSSLVSITGHAGCTDYAMANRSMELFTENRKQLVAEGKRAGSSICVAWPAWHAGMAITDKELEFIAKKGFVPINDKQALLILKNSFNNPELSTGFYACGYSSIYEPFLHSLFLPIKVTNSRLVV